MASDKALTKSGDDKPSIVRVRGEAIMEKTRFIRFRSGRMVLVDDKFPHYVPLTKSQFDLVAYEVLDGPTRSMVADAYEYVRNKAENMTEYASYIKFGLTIEEALLSSHLAAGDIEFTQQNRPVIWDMKEVAILYGESLDNAVWRCPYPPSKAQLKDDAEPLPEIMSLAGGDRGLYDDMLQTAAVLLLDKKPDGVIWWVGDGANGKSTFMDMFYRCFPDQLTSLTVKALEDGRDVVSLNNFLGNIVKESSEGRVEDTEVYKALGTHENFRARVFRSQEGDTVYGNIHSIFSANSIPAFNDKGHSALRRTHIIRFRETFDSDPDYERKTFTAEFFSRFVAELMKYAKRLKKQNYRYKFSPLTAGAKHEYDRQANNAAEYAREVVEEGLVAFTGYKPALYTDYERWCGENGYVPLGLTLFRKAVTAAGFEEKMKREDGRVIRVYRLSTVSSDAHLVQMKDGVFPRNGLYTTDGFAPYDPEPIQPEQRSILNNKW